MLSLAFCSRHSLFGLVLPTRIAAAAKASHAWLSDIFDDEFEQAGMLSFEPAKMSAS